MKRVMTLSKCKDRRSELQGRIRRLMRASAGTRSRHSVTSSIEIARQNLASYSSEVAALDATNATSESSLNRRRALLMSLA